MAPHAKVVVLYDRPFWREAGFSGAVSIGDTVMVTDLFVDPAHRGTGLGTALLQAVLDGASRRMTCSSTHPGALAAYSSAGLSPRWRLLTMRGRALGGGVPLTTSPWRHDRRELVEYFRSRGAVVSGDRVVLPSGGAADGSADGGVTHQVLRLITDDHAADLASILAALPAGATVELSVPETHPAVGWLESHGFELVEHDVFFADDGVHLVPQLCLVHRGLH